MSHVHGQNQLKLFRVGDNNAKTTELKVKCEHYVATAITPLQVRWTDKQQSMHFHVGLSITSGEMWDKPCGG